MDEYNIEVDENDNVIGLRPRSEFYDSDYIHRASHLILFNSKNEILVQKRSMNKKWYPGLYIYSVSGTVKDESYEDCIKSEMQEELGISIPAKFLFKYPHFDKLCRTFNSVFIARSDSVIFPNAEEMSEIHWISIENLQQDIKDNPQNYVPHFIEGMRLYFSKYHK